MAICQLGWGDTTLTFKTLYTYSTSSAIFGKVLTTTDTTGLITTYHYDTSTRYLMAVTTSDGTGMAYTYDNLGRQISAKPASVTSSGGEQCDSFKIRFCLTISQAFEKSKKK